MNISEDTIDAATGIFLLSWPVDNSPFPWPMDYKNDGLRHFVEGIIAAALPYLIAEEREACAKLVSEFYCVPFDETALSDIAAAIRERKS